MRHDRWSQCRIVAIEGIDGAGKTTLVSSLATALSKRGRNVVNMAAIQSKSAIYQLALAGIGNLNSISLQLLFASSRYDTLDQIAMSEHESTIILADRYYLSQYAYGSARAGIELEWSQSVSAYLPEPKLTIILDVDPESIRDRLSGDDFENDLSLQRAVRQFYLNIAKEHSYPILDAAKSERAVMMAALNLVETIL